MTLAVSCATSITTSCVRPFFAATPMASDLPSGESRGVPNAGFWKKFSSGTGWSAAATSSVVAAPAAASSCAKVLRVIGG